MPLPRVSFLIPAYNAGRYLAETLQSCLDQTESDFEIVAIDDGSVDHTAAILAEFARRDPRVRFVSRANTGAVRAANEALALCRGEYIARIDADDVNLPGRLASQVAFLDARPDHVMVGSRTLMIDDAGLPIGDMAWIDHTHEDIERALLYGGWPVIHSSCLIRAETLRAVGGYSEGTFPYDDLDLFLRLAERGRIDNLRETLVKYRRHANSALGTARNTMPLRARIMADARARRGLPDATPADRAMTSGDARPTGTPRTAVDLHCPRDWAWTALRHGYIPTARKYAWRAVRKRPTSAASWRVLVCALRGR